MEASILDLRYRMKDVLKALDRKEPVTVLYRGHVKGTIIPSTQPQKQKVKDHPFFGSSKSDISVEEKMAELRGGRFDDL